jgi:hypothetical protein
VSTNGSPTLDVDVLMIQETKQRPEAFPENAFAELGYQSVHVGQGQWNGVAIVSRIGLEDVDEGLGDPLNEARFVGATWGRSLLFLLRAERPFTGQPPLRVQARVARTARRASVGARRRCRGGAGRR